MRPGGYALSTVPAWWPCSAWCGDELAGVTSYELGPDETSAEVALAVADRMHRRGVATLLLEHLVSVARARGVQAFTAEVLAGNYAVLHVLSDFGLALRRRLSNGTVDVSMPIPRLAALGEASAYLDAVAGRDLRAGVASLEPLLTPRSVAVVGAGRRPRSAGRTILLNIRDAGFAGRCTRSARAASPSTASRASRRWPRCPRRPTWRW